MESEVAEVQLWQRQERKYKGGGRGKIRMGGAIEGRGKGKLKVLVETAPETTYSRALKATSSRTRSAFFPASIPLAHLSSFHHVLAPIHMRTTHSLLSRPGSPCPSRNQCFSRRPRPQSQSCRSPTGSDHSRLPLRYQAASM